MTEIIKFDSLDEIPGAQRRMDTAETVFIDTQLRQLDARIFEQKFEPLDGDKICPIAGGLEENADFYTYRLRRHSGKAKYIQDAPTDVSTVNQAIEKQSVRIVRGAVGYRLSERDVARARTEGIPLEAGNDIACIRALNELRNDAILFGAPSVGLNGFFGNSLTPVSKAATAINPASSADNDLLVLNDWVNKIAERTNGVEMPNRFVLPLSIYNVLASKARSSVSDTTVLAYWAENNPYVRMAGGMAAIDLAPNLDGGIMGAAQGAVGVALNFDERNVGQRVIPPRRFKVVPRLFDFLVVYLIDFTDVYYRYPKGVHILTNMGG